MSAAGIDRAQLAAGKGRLDELPAIPLLGLIMPLLVIAVASSQMTAIQLRDVAILERPANCRHICAISIEREANLIALYHVDTVS